jgi:tetratricopeptide (TPR) repeat protein
MPCGKTLRQLREPRIGPKAIPIWTRLLAIQPNDVDALLGRANAHSELGQHTQALADDKKATELSPNDLRAWNNLCWHNLSAGKWEQTRSGCERSHDLAPNQWGTNLNLGHVFLLSGDRATAQQWYNKTLPLLESNQDLTGVLGEFDLLIKRGMQVKGAKLVRSWFVEQIGLLLKGEQLNQQVLDLYDQGNDLEALPLAQQVVAFREQTLGSEHPAVSESLNNLAAILQGQGQHEQAEPFHRRALAIREKALGLEHTDVAVSLTNLAQLNQNKGQE